MLSLTWWMIYTKALSYTQYQKLKAIHNYGVFFNGIEGYLVHAPPLKDNYVKDRAPQVMPKNEEILLSKLILRYILKIEQNTFVKLRDAHDRYTSARIPNLVDRAGVTTFANIHPLDDNWAEYEGSKGYVFVGGGQFSWLAFLAIRQLRLTGLVLPAQLFFPRPQEYEESFCNEVMHKYNVECVVIDRKLSEMLESRYAFGPAQYKVLALLHSKFENTLYLDADNVPVRALDHLFDQQVYRKSGFVLWPDAWARTTNPQWYDIAGAKVVEKKTKYSAYDFAEAKRQGSARPKPLDEYRFGDSHFHDFKNTLPTLLSETGTVLIHKTKHLQTLLLALYYNILGPDFYYPLLSQGAGQDSDKETFISAAHALGLPYYQVRKQFRWIGYFSRANGEFAAKGLAQWDPQQLHDKHAKMEDPWAYIDDRGPEHAGMHVVTMHMRNPKMLPEMLRLQHELRYPESGEDIRMYEAAYESAGYDIDLRMFAIMVPALCSGYQGRRGTVYHDYMGDYLEVIRSNREAYDQWCDEELVPHMRHLLDTSHYIMSANV